VRVNSEKLGITLGVRFVDSSYPSDRGDCFNETVVGEPVGMTFGMRVEQGLDHSFIIITFIITLFRTNNRSCFRKTHAGMGK
jgi:hypothetical protein